MKKLSLIFFGFVILFLAIAFIGLNSISTVKAEEKPKKEKPHKEVCGPKGDDVARCHARVIVDDKGKPQVTSGPTGYGPAQFQGAYSLGGASSSGRILAVVDAFDHPNIKSDLDFYGNTFGLPNLPTCSGPIKDSPIPCFQKVDQNGGTNYPSVDSGWALEIALDVEAARAVCPDCKILLVEATTNSYYDLMTAVDRAVTMGAKVVSNSYGSGEFSSETLFDSHFNVPGIAFTFSSGDSGYRTGYPAASKYVTAVGGTSLYVNSDNSYKSEVVWSGSGSGCSLYESKPVWQKDGGCARRMIADVSADADPNTGAAVYDTVSYGGQTGWFQVGGTSLSAPIIAGVYALKGIPAGTAANSLPYLNSPSTNLHDVIFGSNGRCRRQPQYFCNAIVGFDGPTGLGTPKGINGF